VICVYENAAWRKGEGRIKEVGGRNVGKNGEYKSPMLLTEYMEKVKLSSLT